MIDQQTSQSSAIAAIEDILEIQKLLARYCYLIDKGAIDEAMELFHPDILFHPAYEGDRQYKGLEAVKNWYMKYSAINEKALQFLRHTISSPVIDVNGNEAVSMCNMDADAVVEKTKEASRHIGRYEDKLVKVDGRWLLIERTIFVNKIYSLGPQP